MKRIISAILAVIMIFGVLCFASCEKGDETSKDSKTDTSDKKYIVAEEIEKIAFDVQNKSMTLVINNPYATLNRKIVFEDGIIRETNNFAGDELEHTSVYRYTETDGKITAFSTNGIDAKIEYDEKERMSKITYAVSDKTYNYAFSYNESGVMEITSDVKKDLNLYSHTNYARLITDFEFNEAAVEEGDLMVTAETRKAAYPIYEVSKEEFELFSIYYTIDFAREIHLTFDRGFVYRY